MNGGIPRGDACDDESSSDDSLIVPAMSNQFRNLSAVRNLSTDNLSSLRLSRPTFGRNSSTAAIVRTLRANRRSFKMQMIWNSLYSRYCIFISPSPSFKLWKRPYHFDLLAPRISIFLRCEAIERVSPCHRANESKFNWKTSLLLLGNKTTRSWRKTKKKQRLANTVWSRVDETPGVGFVARVPPEQENCRTSNQTNGWRVRCTGCSVPTFSFYLPLCVFVSSPGYFFLPDSSPVPAYWIANASV